MNNVETKSSDIKSPEVKAPSLTTKNVLKKNAKKLHNIEKAASTEIKAPELTVQNQIAPFSVKKKKSDKKKVVRDSFSFPLQDYHKISELKKICLEAGVHVKKGEILRVGLNLLTSLKLEELLLAVERIERVPTGRPKAD